ncbi:hypothetical protein CFI00_17040 [Nocardioides sp. S5]|nr:hypothetical protein CFI00_17040 [Nocardioides sp. S5]
MHSLNGGNAIAVIRRLNPIIRGGPPTTGEWFRRTCSPRSIINLWGRLYRWALRAHPNKSVGGHEKLPGDGHEAAH